MGSRKDFENKDYSRIREIAFKQLELNLSDRFVEEERYTISLDPTGKEIKSKTVVKKLVPANPILIQKVINNEILLNEVYEWEEFCKKENLTPELMTIAIGTYPKHYLPRTVGMTRAEMVKYLRSDETLYLFAREKGLL